MFSPWMLTCVAPFGTVTRGFPSGPTDTSIVVSMVMLFAVAVALGLVQPSILMSALKSAMTAFM